MRRVFTGTLYWLAIFLSGNTWSEAALAVHLADASLITTEEVLSESLTAVSAGGTIVEKWV